MAGAAADASLGFVENRGQLADGAGAPVTAVRYLLRTPGLNVQLRAGRFSYDTWVEEAGVLKFHRVDVALVGADADARLIPSRAGPDVLNFFSGSAPVTGVRRFAHVLYKDVYPGIDLQFVAVPGSAKPVEYNFLVHPGANPEQIRLRYTGAHAAELLRGAVSLTLAHGTVAESIPASWVGEARHPLEVEYAQGWEDGEFTFSVPPYDAAQTLTIDPSPKLLWGTYYGGTTIDRIVPGSDGFVYVLGAANVSAGVATAGAFQTTLSGSTDLFLAKFSAAGVRQWGTFFGAAGNEEPGALAVTPDGTGIYIGGRTLGVASPTALGTAGVFDGARDGASDGVIAKFDNTGARIWSGYFGGPGADYISSLVVAPGGDLIAGGRTTSSSGIAVGLPLTTFGGGVEDGFIARILANGTAVLWSQYVGDAGADRVIDVGATTAGDLYAGGATTSLVGISTAVSFQPAKLGGASLSPFIRKYSSTGTLLWGTYYNVSAFGSVRYAVEAGGDIFFGGNVPVGPAYPYAWSTSGAHQTAPTPTAFPLPQDVVLARFSGAGARLWGTYYGAGGTESLYDLQTGGGLLYLSGYAEGGGPGLASACPPYSSGGSGPSGGAGAHAFVSKFSGVGALEWGTGLPGFSTYPYAVGPNGLGEVYVGGGGGDATLVTPGAHDPGPPGAGTSGTFLIKLDDGFLPDSFTVTPSVISLLSQTACILGWAQIITGNVVTQTGPIGYSTPLFYQWQQAPSATGPWTDILGQVFKDYQPTPTTTTTYYRRLVLAFSGCPKVPVDSSAVAVVLININAAPVANSGGGAFLICPGLSVTLGGSPSAAGGLLPYSYAWWAGAVAGPPFSTAAAPTSGPIFSGTTYTLQVVDANGCIDFDRTSVTPVAYNAGPDVNYCGGGPGVQLGTVPEPGTTFAWTPAAGLSCTTCAQPIAMPAVATTYYVTQTVPTLGGICTVSDTVVVTPLSPPNNNPFFAGPDTTICRGGTATIGTSADATFFYAWSPTTYLGFTAFGATATFNAGGNTQPPCPLIYTLTAYKGTCAFTDAAVVSVINPDLDNYGPVCGPVWVNGAGPISCAGTAYSWSLVSG